MKIERLEKIYALGLLIICAGIVIHAPLSVFLGTHAPAYALIIKSWKEIIMLLLMPLAAYLVTRRQLWPEFSRDWIFRLLIAYAVLHIACVVLFYTGVQSTMAGLAIDLRYVLFFALLYTLLRIAPRYKQTVLKIVVAGAVVVLGFAVTQLFLPADILSHIGYSDATIEPYLTVDKNPDYIRVNSTLRGPNPLGAYAAVALALIAAFIARSGRKLRDTRLKWGLAVLAALGAVALWVSYSRSSVLALLIAVVVIVPAVGIKKIPSKVAWTTGGIVAVLIAAGLIMAQQSQFISNVILHENPVGGSSVSSNEGHAESLTVGFAQFVHQPLGAGVGSTGSASLLGTDKIIIENQYLFIAHEVGWLGIALYVAIFAFVLHRLWQARTSWLALGMFASGLGLAFVGLIQPVWVDDTVSILWWGLAAVAIIGGAHHGRSTTKQKTA